jgi:hypothetical protein
VQRKNAHYDILNSSSPATVSDIAFFLSEAPTAVTLSETPMAVTLSEAPMVVILSKAPMAVILSEVKDPCISSLLLPLSSLDLSLKVEASVQKSGCLIYGATMV